MSGEDRPRLICRCHGVASPPLYAAVRAQALDSVAAITKAVRAGGGCRMCHPELEELLDEVHGRPVDPGLALENQTICREETRARIGAVLERFVRPRLAEHGVGLDAWEVDGLRVRVALAGPDRDGALRVVREQLRRHVCAELEVERL